MTNDVAERIDKSIELARGEGLLSADEVGGETRHTHLTEEDDLCDQFEQGVDRFDRSKRSFAS